MEVSAGTVAVFFTAEGIYRLSLLSKGSLFLAGEQKEAPWPGLRRDLERFFDGKGKDIAWKYPVIMRGYSSWTRKVLEAAREIPFGQTWTYGRLAEKTGSPRAARAVGQALGRNRTPVLIPCHRVIDSGGTPGGFGAGVEWKKELLKLEGIEIREKNR